MLKNLGLLKSAICTQPKIYKANLHYSLILKLRQIRVPALAFAFYVKNSPQCKRHICLGYKKGTLKNIVYVV